MTGTTHLPDYAPPLASDLAKPFYEGLAAGELRLTACPACGEIYWYPPHILPCHPDAAAVWRPVSPTGIVYSFTTIERSLLPGASRDSVPYTLVMVEPDDAPGARVIGVMTGADEDRIGCGDTVRLSPIRVGDHIIAGFAHAAGPDEAEATDPGTDQATESV